MAALAETREVSMCFGDFVAVDSVSLAIERGQVIGLLGANGAGKTTLIRLLLGLLRPSSGAVQLFSAAPSVSTRRRVGYVPQTLGLYVDLTVEENWSFTTAAFRSGASSPSPSISAWNKELVGTLPLGAQRQVAFAVALSHRPDLLVLDEPTSGVSPLGRARLWQEIRHAADQGTGVLVTTHNMEEAEQCDHLVVMLDGRVVASGTATEIVGDRTVVEVRCDDWRSAFEALDSSNVAVEVRGAVLRAAGSRDAITNVLSQHGIDAAVDLAPANLDEAFIAIVAGTSI